MEAYTKSEHDRAMDRLAADMEAGRGGHTPGPWRLETRYIMHAIVCEPTRVGEFPEIVFTERYGFDQSGSITSRKRSESELEANARLIAAAPDLAEALQEIIRYTAPLCQSDDPLGHGIKRLAAAALAKAGVS